MLHRKKLFLLLLVLPLFSFASGFENLNFVSKTVNNTSDYSLPTSFKLFYFNSFHKFYVSVTEIEYVPEKHSLQIISKIFVDDFQKMLQQRYDSKIELGKGGRDQTKVDFYIDKYFGEKFEIDIERKPLKIDYIGKRYEDDLLICYFEISDIEVFNKISVTNSVLTDLFEEQKNLIHIKNKGTTKSLLLVKEKPEGSLSFK